MFVGVRRAASAVLAMVAAAGVLTACSGSGDEPRTLPPLSTTPVVSTTSPPALDKKQALAQAEAVVREYFRLLNELSNTATPEDFRSIETRTCSCRKFVRSLEKVSARGQHYFGHANITGLTPSLDSADVVEVLVTYDSSRGGIKSDDGRVVTSSQGRRGVTGLFYVHRVGSTWLISNIVQIREGRSR